MDKTTQNNFSKRLGHYGAMVAAVAGVANSQGQIVYTDISDATVNPGFGFNIDINGDTTVDFLVTVNPSAPAGAFFRGSFIDSSSNIVANSNQFLGTSINSYYYPFNLANGAVISSTPTSGSFLGDVGTMNFETCFPGMEFCDNGGATVEGFVGLKFLIGTDTHYGWVRIETSPTTAIIKDFAYNATPNASLLAGQQTLSLDQQSLEDIRIVALNKSIGIYNMTEATEYSVFAITGQSVLNGSINDRSYTIEANMLETGIYILELRDKQTNAVIRKKVIL